MFGQGQIPTLFCVQPRKCLQFLGKHVLVFTTTYLDNLVLLCTSTAPVARGLFLSGAWTTGSMFLPPQQCVEICVQFQELAGQCGFFLPRKGHRNPLLTVQTPVHCYKTARGNHESMLWWLLLLFALQVLRMIVACGCDSSPGRGLAVIVRL